ncbi:hypothetical protein OEZ85_006097 [Tetradesmus obliquus]|uniref:Uncharacterized protein n=1 Tax=Tetradesmus obliquus TaxID=3088 RepID=A0ABY8UG71_TETOB|nr:hypothetical protein OEZ85_006097 [Tetradesmus obliquus]
MSESGSSGTGFSSHGDASSVASSANTDRRAITAFAAASSGIDEQVDNLEAKKGLLEVVFATLYTLTKNRVLDASLRLATARVVLEFLQMFRVLFNTTFAWKIQKSLWIWRTIEWTLFRALVIPAGYDKYIFIFYVVAGVVLGVIGATVCVALYLKGNEARSSWLKRLIGLLQLLALLVFGVMWPAVLDYCVFLLDCSWSDLAAGKAPHHITFAEQSK